MLHGCVKHMGSFLLGTEPRLKCVWLLVLTVLEPKYLMDGISRTVL